MGPEIQVQQITNPETLQQGRVFAEALQQTKPLATAGTREAAQCAAVVGEGTALPSGLRPDTITRLVTEGRSLESLIGGANPKGRMAEIVSISDYRELHAEVAEPAIGITGSVDFFFFKFSPFT